jgi:hypothetical protein
MPSSKTRKKLTSSYEEYKRARGIARGFNVGDAQPPVGNSSFAAPGGAQNSNNLTIPRCQRVVAALTQFGWTCKYYVQGPVNSPTPYPSPMTFVYYEADLRAAGVLDTDLINAYLWVQGSPQGGGTGGGIGAAAIEFLLNRGGMDSLAHIITGIEGAHADVNDWTLRILLGMFGVKAAVDAVMKG